MVTAVDVELNTQFSGVQQHLVDVEQRRVL